MTEDEVDIFFVKDCGPLVWRTWQESTAMDDCASFAFEDSLKHTMLNLTVPTMA